MHDQLINFRKELVAQSIKGTVKWYNVKCGYGFINRKDTNEDVFLHQTGIARFSPNKCQRSVGDGEEVEFDLVWGLKGLEAVNVTGPNGKAVQGSRYALDRKSGSFFEDSAIGMQIPMNNYSPFARSLSLDSLESEDFDEGTTTPIKRFHSTPKGNNGSNKKDLRMDFIPPMFPFCPPYMPVGLLPYAYGVNPFLFKQPHKLRRALMRKENFNSENGNYVIHNFKNNEVNSRIDTDGQQLKLKDKNPLLFVNQEEISSLNEKLKKTERNKNADQENIPVVLKTKAKRSQSLTRLPLVEKFDN